MKRKISAIIISLLLLGSIIVFVNNELNVEAADEGEGGGDFDNIGLDYDFMWDVTETICDAVYKAYEGDEITKGREFGTKGENWTANQIVGYMVENCSLENVEKIPLGPIEYCPARYYTSKINVSDYLLHIDNPDYNEDTGLPNDVPVNESFVFPQAAPKNWTGPLTFNSTMTDEENVRVIEPLLDNWPAGGTLTNCYLNLSVTAANQYDFIIGNATYVAEDDPLPLDQDGRVLIFDEEELECEERLENVTNASGVILIHDVVSKYSTPNASNCSFSVGRVNSDDSNLSEILEMLSKNEIMIVENIISNETLTFTYNVTCDFLIWPDYNFIIIDKLELPTPEGNKTYVSWLSEYTILFRLCNLLISGLECRGECKGVILFNEYTYGNTYNVTHFMNVNNPSLIYGGWFRFGYGSDYSLINWLKSTIGSPGLPIYWVNHSVGSWLYTHAGQSGNTVTGYVNQNYLKEIHWPLWDSSQWTSGVNAYNVIGNITTDRSGNSPNPDDPIILISNRYDAWWSEAAFDSGCGVGVVLAIAKYFQDYNITPKVNITFLETTGEEYLFRGAQHFSDSHPNINYSMWIGFDQLASNWTGSTLDLTFNDDEVCNVVETIGEQMGYPKRTNNNYSMSYDVTSEFTGAEEDVWKQRDLPQKEDGIDCPYHCKTICFCKSLAGTYGGNPFRHRRGEQFSEGDLLKNIDREDLNDTLELTWNITKYFCVNPNCWFSNVTFEPIDSEDDGDTLNDSIRTTFEINTVLPNDQVRVWADIEQYVDDTGQSINYTLYKDYIATYPGVEKTWTIPIPDIFNHGNCSIQLKIMNSTERIDYIATLGETVHYNDTSSRSSYYHLYHPFGYIKNGNSFKCVGDNISGSVFMANQDGYADNITAYINQVYMSPGPYKCMLYRANDSNLIATTTENWTVRDIENPISSTGWAVFEFPSPKPELVKDTQYVITCWGDNSYSRLYYDDFPFQRGRYDSEAYGSPPSLADFTNESGLYSLYCSYGLDTAAPEITSVTNNPSVVGFGFNVTITANVTDDESGVDAVKANITYPDHTHGNYTMTHTTGNTYQYTFNDTWDVGQYNYTIWTIDNSGNGNSSAGHHFHVSATATISIATLEDTYGDRDYINITDPPIPTEDYYLVDRGLTWDEYYNAITGENALEISAGPINYQDGNNEWTPIDCTLNILNSNHPAYQHGYRVGNDQGLYSVYFKPNAQNDWPVAFAYDKSNDPTTNVVRSKLVGVGYLDPTSNWEYKYLQNVQSSQGQINGNSATYENVFTGTDVTWSYDNTQLKEAITLSDAAKTLLQNHPPSNYGLSNDNSYLVFITKLDHQNLNMYDSSGMLDGNVTVYDEHIDFKDTLGNFKCALPVGDAYELNDEQARQKLTYRIIQYNGNTYLLSGLKLSDLNAMTFPVVIDPTLSIESLTNDGYIYKSSGTYNTAWTSSTGTISSSATYMSIGQKKDPVAPPTLTYSIYRGFVLFDTSRLPSNAYIDNATLSLYKYGDYSTTDFTITVQNGQPTYPHNPLQTADYSKSYYSGNGGGLNTINFVNGRNNITLTNHSWLTKEGTTKLCLRSSRDINGTAPTGNEYVSVYSGDASATYRPKLIVIYRNQSKIKDTGLTDIKGYLLIQVQFHNISWPAGQWVVDQDAVNETTSRTINAGQQIPMDTIFNGLVNTIDLTHGNGRYRVYAAFRDTYGNILQTDDGRFLAAWWEFDVNI